LLEYECGGDPADDDDDECGSIKEFWIDEVAKIRVDVLVGDDSISWLVPDDER
jgi:hypothetical protein